ncbi:MAG: hypothetical protein F6K28_26430 [Microcoleus sp. SIO2G3]|nr:hypothetical protein [Microcoleus sp. SIO2G3]
MASFFPRIGAGRRSASRGDRNRRSARVTPAPQPSRASATRELRRVRTAPTRPDRDRIARLQQRLAVQTPVQVTRWRLTIVWGILLLAGLLLTANLYRLQIVEAAELRERAQAQQIAAIQPFVPRRPIVDAEGNVLAIDRPSYTLYAHPILFETARRAVADQLAPILDQSAAALTDKMLSGDSGIELEFALSEEVADRIRALQLDGLELVQRPQRLYPQQDLFASVVGYVNLDREGKAGLEMGQQKQLERSILISQSS